MPNNIFQEENKMNEINIAIISKNKTLSRLFELEALDFDVSTSVLDRMPSDTSAFSCFIIDIDTVKPKAVLENDKCVFISENESNLTNSDIKGMVWPLPIGKIRKLYGELLVNAVPKEYISKNEEKETIFFYRKTKNTVKYKNISITFSDNEFKILKCLCENAPQEVSRDILDALVGTYGSNITDVYICKLRKKVEEPFGKKVIFTVRSKGYKIMTDVEWE